MADPLGSSSAEEATGAKSDFIGKVTFSRVDCDCSICESGREASGGEYTSDVDHLMAIEPLTEYEKQQNVLGIDVRRSFGSKWMLFVGHVENIIGSLEENGVEDLDDFTALLEGRTFEFRELTFEEDEEFVWEHAKGGEGYSAVIKDLFAGMTNPPSPMLVPVREVTDPDELAELGAEEAGDVEEVDF